MNIVLTGFMSSGKTVVGTELAKITGRKFVDTDEMVEKKQAQQTAEIVQLPTKNREEIA